MDNSQPNPPCFLITLLCTDEGTLFHIQMIETTSTCINIRIETKNLQRMKRRLPAMISHCARPAPLPLPEPVLLLKSCWRLPTYEFKLQTHSPPRFRIRASVNASELNHNHHILAPNCLDTTNITLTTPNDPHWNRRQDSEIQTAQPLCKSPS